MFLTESAPPGSRRSRRVAPLPSPVATRGLTIYGCGQDEAELFEDLSPQFGVSATITDAPISEGNVGLAAGDRCVSVCHRADVTNPTLLALSRAGVRNVITRSVGCNHIDVAFAEGVGISVGTVPYSPDSVADYTLMLMLMAVRHAKAVIRRIDRHDYRLEGMRGKELRDLTIGVVGTGRIGSAVISRLRGFGCRVLAHEKLVGDRGADTPLDELLALSDVVTLHTPLTAETHHLLSPERIARLKRGAIVINTGRGSLIDTGALVAALECGRLGGAALDVVEGEEGIFYADRGGEAIDHEWLLRLQQLPNVLVSPHIAYYTDHALLDIVENSLVACVAAEGGGEPS